MHVCKTDVTHAGFVFPETQVTYFIDRTRFPISDRSNPLYKSTRFDRESHVMLQPSWRCNEHCNTYFALTYNSPNKKMTDITRNDNCCSTQCACMHVCCTDFSAWLTYSIIQKTKIMQSWSVLRQKVIQCLNLKRHSKFLGFACPHTSAKRFSTFVQFCYTPTGLLNYVVF